MNFNPLESTTAKKKKAAKSIVDFSSIAKRYGDKIVDIYPFTSSELLDDHSDPKRLMPGHEPGGIQKNIWFRLESESYLYETSPEFRSDSIIQKRKKSETYEQRKPENRLELIGNLLRNYFKSEEFSVIYHKPEKVKEISHRDVPDEDIILFFDLAGKYSL